MEEFYGKLSDVLIRNTSAFFKKDSIRLSLFYTFPFERKGTSFLFMSFFSLLLLLYFFRPYAAFNSRISLRDITDFFFFFLRGIFSSIVNYSI